MPVVRPSRFPTYYAYVDAGHVRASLVRAGHSPEFDPRAVIKAGVPWEPERVFFYDALDDSDPVKLAQQESYLDRIERLHNTHLATGIVRGRKGNRRQKGVDVALAVDALTAAHAHAVEMIVLVTGDADFTPLVDAIRRTGPHVMVMAFEGSYAEELRVAADQFRPLRPPPALGAWELLP
jgi:uncharacterized LabA/DUF88 family protein